MNYANEDIKSEFEKQIDIYEKQDENKNQFFMNIMYVVFTLLFIAVLVGTILSYVNYKKVKDGLNDSSTQVIEFK